jgi:hypothetical protein
MEDMAVTRSRPSKRLRLAHGGQFQREKTKNWQDMVEIGRRRKEWRSRPGMQEVVKAGRVLVGEAAQVEWSRARVAPPP